MGLIAVLLAKSFSKAARVCTVTKGGSGIKCVPFCCKMKDMKEVAHYPYFTILKGCGGAVG